MTTNIEIPKAPSHLSVESKGWWKKILGEYDLPEEALLILASGLEALDRVRQAQRSIKEIGIVTVTKSKNGQMVRQNPAVGIELDAKRVMLACFRQLGLDLEPLHDKPGRPAGK